MADDKMLIDPNKRVGFEYSWGEGTADKWAGDLGNKASGYVQQQGAADKRAAQARSEQQSQIDRLGRIARGEQSSPAEMQLREQNRQGQALMASQAAGARGGFAQAMAAQRAAAMGQAASSQNLVGQAAQVRAQAQMQAQDQLADALAQQRAMDYAQREAAMRGGLNATGSQLDFIRAQDQLNQSYAELSSQYRGGLREGALRAMGQDAQREQQQEQNDAQSRGTWISTLAVAAPFLAKLSDRERKRDIKNGDPAARSLLDALAAKTFHYRANPDGPRELGVIAQDLERTPEGRAIVRETPEGKAIDVAAGLGAALAGLADINRRLKRLEKR